MLDSQWYPLKLYLINNLKILSNLQCLTSTIYSNVSSAKTQKSLLRETIIQNNHFKKRKFQISHTYLRVTIVNHASLKMKSLAIKSVNQSRRGVDFYSKSNGPVKSYQGSEDKLEKLQSRIGSKVYNERRYINQRNDEYQWHHRTDTSSRNIGQIVSSNTLSRPL